MRLLALFFCITTLTFGDELLRPTADANSTNTNYGCSGTNVTFTSFPNAYDAAGLATSSTGSVAGGGCQKFIGGNCVVPGKNQYSARLFSGWMTSGNSWASLTINVNSSSGGGFLGSDSACIAYSTNGGGTWTSIRCSGTGWAQSTSTVSISTGQNLSQLQVGICVQGTGFPNGGSGSGTDSITVWDIWTLGTNNVPPTPAAPSPAGKPSDPLIISRWLEELMEMA